MEITEKIDKLINQNNRRIIFYFDDEGKLIEEKWYKSDGNLSEKSNYKYPEYDENGNWLMQHIFLNDALEPSRIIKREISYY